jgi:nucleoside diphosphate kinase
MERTFIMLKPDAIQRGLMGEILGRIEAKGHKPVAPTNLPSQSFPECAIFC